MWHSDGIWPFTITQHINTFVDTIRTLISNTEVTVEECLRPTTHDLDQIWAWNRDVPPTIDRCMHDVISERAQTCLDKVAIASWDGSLTYAQVDRYSTFLAISLTEDYGVELHDFVPVCFEKSRWTIVAVLAVMKAGATLVMMDPTIPLARLQNMGKQVGAKMMVASATQIELARAILPEGKHAVVEANTFKTVPDSFLETPPRLPEVPPSALMYIIFTSGSTGTPKGVQINHRTYTSSAFPRAAAVGYKEDTRTLDFASYAFDVSIDSMLLTLANGGSLCIPSDNDRLNDVGGVIQRMQINYAGITPSMARILDLDVIASLDVLGLGGEAASATDVNRWGQLTRIVIGYGPCECTIGCTINSSAATGRDYITIGPGNGAAMWVVDPNNHDVLMPIGAVGELLVEGPIVGQGYLGDPEKTATVFISDPAWLVAGHGENPGRKGLLYKTGDLGRYDPYGTGEIVFVGRKDTQVKLRGQRVELGEIESHLKARLPSDVNVIAEVIAPAGASSSQHTLVAFVAPQSTKRDDAAEIVSAHLPAEMQEALSKAATEVTEVLPRYMVPNAYIPVNFIPTLISGKTDRKRLRQFGATVDLRQLADQTVRASKSTIEPSDSRPLSETGKLLQQAWAQILRLEADAIRADDNFFALGGDSLAAMKMVTLCRENGLDLSVTGTFGNPTLSAMAGVVKVIKEEAAVDAGRIPFSLISQSPGDILAEASLLCGVEPAAVEDIYPCTPTQESLFTFSLKSDEAYIAQRLTRIPCHITLDAWKEAWETVVAANPILRTRLAQLHDDPSLRQVVVKGNIHWNHAADLTQYLQDDHNAKMNFGECLARYAIIESSPEERHMVWTLHHVVYDGWSEPLLLHQVRDALLHHTTPSQAAYMGDFVKYVRDADETAMQEYWRKELDGATGPQFPRVPSRDFLPHPDTLIEHHIPLDTSSGRFPFTSATLIRAAWALVASQYTGSDDIVFGETLTGRDIPLSGVEGIVGPLIATVPVRVRVDRSTTIASYLETVQLSMLTRTPFQHMGMQNIRRVSRDAQYACEAPMGIVIQPEPDYQVGDELGFQQSDVVKEAIHFNPYSLMLACGIQKGGFRVCASFDSSLLEVSHMERILTQMETACTQLRRDLNRRIDKISCLLGGLELDQIWRWNETAPLSVNKNTGALCAGVNVTEGSVYPRPLVPWVCDPRTPGWLSPIGCTGELWLEGDILSGEAIVENPAWLSAGSSTYSGRAGRVQPTGDIVRLEEDGSLIFVGRKENIAPAQGYAINVADLEVHFAKYLTPEVRAAAVVSHLPSDGGSRVIVFVEQTQLLEAGVALLPTGFSVTSEPSSGDPFTSEVPATVSAELVAALKRLDKFSQNSLASHLVPSAYIVVNKLPVAGGQIDRGCLGHLLQQISQDSLTHIRNSLQQSWANNVTQTKVTGAEDILRAAWSKILGIPTAEIDVDDNFFRLGGDSVLAMKLVSYLRTLGHRLTVADIFQKMRLGDAATALKLNDVPVKKQSEAQVYKPFSMLGSLDIEPFLAEVVRPRLADSSWSVQDVYPVTDSQALDIKATVKAPRTSLQYTMLYFNSDVDREKLVQSCAELVKTHDILRTVFVEYQSTLLQVVLKDLNVSVPAQQIETELEKFVTEFCATQADADIQLGSPFFQFFHIAGNEGRHCLVLGLSHALYDGVSLPRLLQDLERIYTGGKVSEYTPFSAYIAHTTDAQTQTKASSYWRDLLSGSYLSELPAAPAQPGDKAVFKSNPLDVPEAPRDITTANLLTAAWALVLARRLHTTDVTFGGVTSGRTLDLAHVENVVGPCYQFTPIRVTFQPEWTAMDLLQFVQKQSAESSAYDFLGFEAIANRCTQWPAEQQFFGSLVNHQDWEDFDTMPFAGGSCRVEILNPHGDAVYPMKVVSFVREGKTHVGVVGSEKSVEFVDSVLKEVGEAFVELAAAGSERLVLDREVVSVSE